MDDFHKERMKSVKIMKRKLSKVSVGLPLKVVFKYKEGLVVCYPKTKKWIVTPKGKKSTIHFVGGRGDVTKYKARHLLRLAIIKLLRDDSDSR